MADYKVYVDGLLDNLIKSDKAILKYGGIAVKGGISFIQDGGMEKISKGLNSANDALGEIRGSIFKVKEQAAGIAGSAAQLANSLIGTLTPIMSKAGPAVATSISPMGLVSAFGSGIQNLSVQKNLDNLGSEVGNIHTGMEHLGNEVGNLHNEIHNLDQGMFVLSDKVADISSVMARIHSLSWIGAGASVLNCGISVAGFALVLNQLKEVQKKLDDIGKRMDQALVGRANVVLNNLMHYMQKLSGTQVRMTSEDNLVRDLNETTQLIADLAELTQRKEADVTLIMHLLLPLNTTFEKVVKEYSIRSYYENGSWPVNLQSWEQALNIISQLPICENVNYHMHLEYPECSEKELATCIKYIRDDLIQTPIRELKDTLAFIEETKMTKDEYSNLPNEIVQKITDNEYEKTTARMLSEVYGL